MVLPTSPQYDYPHLPGDESNPLMESPLHARWVQTLLGAIRNTLAHTDAMVTGNTPFIPQPGTTHTAPDLMVIPGARDATFASYRVGVDGPAPTVCIEVISRSNSMSELGRRLGRWVDADVAEVYALHPERQTFERVIRNGADLRWTDARGAYSPGLNATIALVNDRLAVCFPGGRAVGVDDDSFAWLAEEQRRADQAELRAEMAVSRAETAESRAETAESRAETAESRAETAESRAETAESRAEQAGARIAALEAELQALRDER